jgi:hypothetical protein
MLAKIRAVFFAFAVLSAPHFLSAQTVTLRPEFQAPEDPELRAQPSVCWRTA